MLYVSYDSVYLDAKNNSITCNRVVMGHLIAIDAGYTLVIQLYIDCYTYLKLIPIVMKWSVFVTLLLCLVHNLPAIADVIPVETAKEYAARILSSGLRSSSSVRLVKTVYSQSSLRTTEPVLYLFAEEENSGFAWIAADDAVQPLIGFSRINSIDLDHMPPALTELLDQYESEIIKARESNLPSLTNSMPDPDEWTEKRLETALWEQHDPYYLKTPLIEGRHCVTGCVPTALAIIMRYHRYPDRAHNGVSSYMGNPVSYPKIDWDLMPLEGPRNRKESDAVAQLMWDIGANAQSEYGLKATSTYISKGLDAMKNVFGYNPNATYIEAKGLVRLYAVKSWQNILPFCNRRGASMPVSGYAALACSNLSRHSACGNTSSSMHHTASAPCSHASLIPV